MQLIEHFEVLYRLGLKGAGLVLFDIPWVAGAEMRFLFSIDCA
jgi:hypothetical protein